ncbi:MAG: nicotinate phosphoribosyltransferase [Flavisolibacter sp.]
MISYTATYTDLYQLTMAQVYLEKGRKNEPAVFDYFFRRLPFGGGYAVFAGLETLLNILENLHFDEEDLRFLKENGFAADFLDYLKRFRFSGTLYASREGDVVFPTRPLVRVDASIVEAQLVETILLNVLNFQTLIATKARRMREVAGEKQLVDFGLRRAQGPAGYYAARAAVVGGFDGTSNVRAGRDFNIAVSGTMAHSFIQSHDDELAAFRHYASAWPDSCVLLLDTYDTLHSGLPNAITVAHELQAAGHRLAGVRLDSGDLAYLARECRRRLDEEGLHYVKIAASNQLDENVIKSLQEQQASIDIFGVGTSLVTGHPDGALDGVYKLAFAGGKPRIKLSENIGKITLPDKKQVHRLLNADGRWIGADVISREGEEEIRHMFDPHAPMKSMSLEGLKKEAVLHKVMENGKRLEPGRSVHEVADYCKMRMQQLPDEYKRFDNPHVYKVGISEGLMKERDRMIATHK